MHLPGHVSRRRSPAQSWQAPAAQAGAHLSHTSVPGIHWVSSAGLNAWDRAGEQVMDDLDDESRSSVPSPPCLMWKALVSSEFCSVESLNMSTPCKDGWLFCISEDTCWCDASRHLAASMRVGMLDNGEIFKDLLKIKLECESQKEIWSQHFRWFLKYGFEFKLPEKEFLNSTFQGLNPNVIQLVWKRIPVTIVFKDF